jgi:hypothetical protein
MLLALLFFLYGLAVFGSGVYAYAQAPEGSDPRTALIVTGGMAAVAFVLAFVAMAWRLKSGLFSMVRTLATVVPLLFGGLAIYQGIGTHGAVRRYADALASFEQARTRAASEPGVPAPPQDVRSYIDTLNAPIIQRAIAEGRLSADAPDSERRRLIRAEGTPEHDRTFLRNTLFVIGGISLLVFGAVFLTRPRPPKPAPAPAPAPAQAGKK